MALPHRGYSSGPWWGLNVPLYGKHLSASGGQEMFLQRPALYREPSGDLKYLGEYLQAIKSMLKMDGSFV